MKPFISEGTSDTPDIRFDKENNVFSMSGNSLPEDVIAFYDEVNQWLENYVVDPNPETNFHVKMTYYNSASSKAIASIMAIFEKINGSGKKVKVFWHFLEDDEDMLESGKELSEITDIPFEFVSYVRN